MLLTMAKVGMTERIKKEPTKRTLAFKRWLELNDVKPRRIATLADIPPSTIYSVIDGKSRGFTSENEQKIADAFNLRTEDIFVVPLRGDDNISHVRDHKNDNVIKNYYTIPVKRVSVPDKGAGEPGAIRMIPVVGIVQAGAWTEVENFEYVDEYTEYVPFDDVRYARATVRSLLVQGDSCNLEYPDGAKIFFVPAAEHGVHERDFVIVMAIDAAGKAETTVKQVEVVGVQVHLCPRSTNKRFQDPIIIKSRDEFAQDGMSIVGVVIGSYKPATQGGMLIDI